MIIDQARGRWYSILSRVGVDKTYLDGKHHDCPLCKSGKDRFRWTNRNEKGGYICSQCGNGDGVDFLQSFLNCDFKAAIDEIKKHLPNSEYVKPKPKKDPRILLRKIANSVQPGVDVAGYLKARGLEHHKALKQCKLGYFEDGKRVGTYQAMIALVVDVNNEPVTYHVTYLDGRKKANVSSPKKVMPGIKSMTGCAVRFGDGKRIAIAEGIETSLAIQQKNNIPVWAALNANNLEKIELPDYVEEVFIFADNDENYTGQKAAYTLANRLTLKGIEVQVFIPESIGDDFLDQYTRTA